MIQRSAIVAAARELVAARVPFAHQGRSRVAVDCIGLLSVVASALSIPHAYEATYKRVSSLKTLETGLIHAGLYRITGSEAGPGDVLAFWQGVRGMGGHVAIIGEIDGRRTMIHTTFYQGRVVEETLGDQWSPRIASYWRFPGAV